MTTTTVSQIRPELPPRRGGGKAVYGFVHPIVFWSVRLLKRVVIDLIRAKLTARLSPAAEQVKLAPKWRDKLTGASCSTPLQSRGSDRLRYFSVARFSAVLNSDRWARTPSQGYSQENVDHSLRYPSLCQWRRLCLVGQAVTDDPVFAEAIANHPEGEDGRKDDHDQNEGDTPEDG